MKGLKGCEIFVASQSITPYDSRGRRCHRKLFDSPYCEERVSLGILDSDEIKLDVPMIVPTRWHVSKTVADDYISNWAFANGSIKGLFDLSSLWEFERHIFRLHPSTKKDGLLIYVGDEINENMEFLNSLGYQEARELLRLGAERYPNSGFDL